MYLDSKGSPINVGSKVKLADDFADDAVIKGEIVQFAASETDYDDEAMRPVTQPPKFWVKWDVEGDTEIFTGSWVVHTEDTWEFEELTLVS